MFKNMPDIPLSVVPVFAPGLIAFYKFGSKEGNFFINVHNPKEVRAFNFRLSLL